MGAREPGIVRVSGARSQESLLAACPDHPRPCLGSQESLLSPRSRQLRRPRPSSQPSLMASTAVQPKETPSSLHPPSRTPASRVPPSKPGNGLVRQSRITTAKPEVSAKPQVPVGRPGTRIPCPPKPTVVSSGRGISTQSPVSRSPGPRSTRGRSASRGTGVESPRPGRRGTKGTEDTGATKEKTGGAVSKTEKCGATNSPVTNPPAHRPGLAAQGKAAGRGSEATRGQTPRGRGNPGGEGRNAARRPGRLGGGRSAAGSPARQKPSAHAQGTPGAQKLAVRRAGRGGGGEAGVGGEDMSGKAKGRGEGSAKSSDRAHRRGGGGECRAKSRSLPGDRRTLHASPRAQSQEKSGEVRRPAEGLLARLNSGLREKREEVLTPHLTDSHQPFFQGISPTRSLPTTPRKTSSGRSTPLSTSTPLSSSTPKQDSTKRRRQGRSVLPATDPLTGQRRCLSFGDVVNISRAEVEEDSRLLDTYYPSFPSSPAVYRVWERGGKQGGAMLKHRFVRGNSAPGRAAQPPERTEDRGARAEDSRCPSYPEGGGRAGQGRISEGTSSEAATAQERTNKSITSEWRTLPDSQSEVSQPIGRPLGEAKTLGLGGGRGELVESPTFPTKPEQSPNSDSLDTGRPTVITVRGTPGEEGLCSEVCWCGMLV